MDVRRVCRTEKWYFGQGNDTYAIVDWFWAPPGAAVYSDPTPFRSLDFWDGLTTLADRPGPVKYQLGTFRNGDTPPGYLLPGMAQSPCGKSAYWLDGIPSPPPPPPPLNPDGIPFCCTGRRTAVGTIAGSSLLLGQPPIDPLVQGTQNLGTNFLTLTFPMPTQEGNFLIAFVCASPLFSLTYIPGIVCTSPGWILLGEVTRGWLRQQVWVYPGAPRITAGQQWNTPSPTFGEIFGFMWELAYVPASNYADVQLQSDGDGSISSIGSSAISDWQNELAWIFGVQYYTATDGITDGFAQATHLALPGMGAYVYKQQALTRKSYSCQLLLQDGGGTFPSHPWTMQLVSLRLNPPASLPRGIIVGTSELVGASVAQRRAVAQIVGDSELDGQATGLAGSAGEVVGDSELDAAGTVPTAALGEIIGDSELEGIMRVHWGEPGVIAGDSLLDGISAPIARAAGSIAGDSELVAASRRLARAAGSIAGDSAAAAAGRAAARATGAIAGSSVLSAVGTSTGGSPVVQSAHGSGTLTVSVTWPASTTAGNLLVAFVANAAGISPPVVTPPSGWSSASTIVDASASQRGTIFYKENAAAQGSTGNFTQAGGAPRIMTVTVAEISGTIASSSLDKTATNTGTTGSPSTGTTATTSQANEVAIGGLGYVSSPETFSAPTNGYSIADQFSAASYPVCLLYKVLSATGTTGTGATVSGTTGKWTGVVATFKK